MESEGASRSPRLMEGDLLSSGVIILSGGEDKFGRPLVTFPSDTQDNLYSRHTVAHLVLQIQYYLSLLPREKTKSGVALLADLRAATKETVQMILDTLDKLQTEHRGTVAILYATQPKHKDAQKIFRKKLGLKPSKKNPKVPAFETVIFDDMANIAQHIAPSQLTAEFGGTLPYNHQAWIIFIKKMEELKSSCVEVLHKVPEAQDKLGMLQEYDIPPESAAVQDLLEQVRSKYNEIMRDVNIETVIDDCGTTLRNISKPSENIAYSQISHTQSFKQGKVILEDHRSRLVNAREELKTLWQQAESRIISANKVSRYKEKAEKVLQWIKDVGVPTVNQDPEIADCLSQSEILKTHFETGFYSIAKNVLWLSKKIQKKLEGVFLEVKGHEVSHQVMVYTRRFQATVDHFNQLVEKKYKVYLNVYNFFLTSVRVVKWYRQVLMFLPIQLLRNQPISNNQTSAAIFVSGAWKVAVENFLLNHPAPTLIQLQKVKNVIPVIDNINVRNQARLLVNRVCQIRKFLVNPDLVTVVELKDILYWKEQLGQGHDEVYLSVSQSALDLSSFDQSRPISTGLHQSDHFKSRSPLFSDHRSRSPHHEHQERESSPYLVPSSPMDRNTQFFASGSSLDISSPDLYKQSPLPEYWSDNKQYVNQSKYAKQNRYSSPQLDFVTQQENIDSKMDKSRLYRSTPQLSRQDKLLGISSSYSSAENQSPIYLGQSPYSGMGGELGRKSPLLKGRPYSSQDNLVAGRNSPYSSRDNRLSKSIIPNTSQENVHNPYPTQERLGQYVDRPYSSKEDLLKERSKRRTRQKDLLNERRPHSSQVDRLDTSSVPYLSHENVLEERRSYSAQNIQLEENSPYPQSRNRDHSTERSNPYMDINGPTNLMRGIPHLSLSTPQLYLSVPDADRGSPVSYEMRYGHKPNSVHKESPHLLDNGENRRKSPHAEVDSRNTQNMEAQRAKHNRTPKLRFKGVDENECIDDSSQFEQIGTENILEYHPQEPHGKNILKSSKRNENEKNKTILKHEHMQKPIQIDTSSQTHEIEPSSSSRKPVNDTRPLNERRSMSVPKLDVIDQSIKESSSIYLENIQCESKKGKSLDTLEETARTPLMDSFEFPYYPYQIHDQIEKNILQTQYESYQKKKRQIEEQLLKGNTTKKTEKPIDAQNHLIVPGSNTSQEDELYVSLSVNSTPRPNNLPPTLKHINIKALKKNHPQSQNELQPNAMQQKTEQNLLDPNSKVDPRQRLQSNESLVDSGITQTHSSTTASGASISTNGLNPNNASGLSGQTAENSKIADDLAFDAYDSREMKKSKSALGSLGEGLPVSTQATLQAVVNSSLSMEEKLNLVAALVAVRNEHDVKEDDKSHKNTQDREQNIDLVFPRSHADAVDSPKETFTTKDEATKSLPVRQRTGKLIPSCADQDESVDQYTNEPLMKTQRRPSSGKTETATLPLESSDDIQRYQHEGQDYFMTQRPNKDFTQVIDRTSLSRARPPRLVRNKTFDIPDRGQVELGELALDLDLPEEDRQEALDYADNEHSGKPYGIDIEEWMRRQDLESASDQPPESSTDHPPDSSDIEDWESMQDYVEKWRHAKQGRKSEELALEEARKELADLMVQGEEIAQDNVELSLNRTQRVLQEQEDLKQDHQNSTSQLPLEKSFSLPLTSIDHPKDQSSLAPAGMSLKVPPARRRKFGDHTEGSISEESGVFTQTSLDLLKTSDLSSSNNTSRRTSRTSHSNSLDSPRGHQYKLGIRHQDLQDMLGSVHQMSVDEVEESVPGEEEEDDENNDQDTTTDNVQYSDDHDTVVSRSRTESKASTTATGSEKASPPSGSPRAGLAKSQSCEVSAEPSSPRRSSLSHSHSFPSSQPDSQGISEDVFNDLVRIQAPTSEESSHSNGIGNQHSVLSDDLSTVESEQACFDLDAYNTSSISDLDPVDPELKLGISGSSVEHDTSSTSTVVFEEDPISDPITGLNESPISDINLFSCADGQDNACSSTENDMSNFEVIVNDSEKILELPNSLDMKDDNQPSAGDQENTVVSEIQPVISDLLVSSCISGVTVVDPWHNPNLIDVVHENIVESKEPHVSMRQHATDNYEKLSSEIKPNISPVDSECDLENSVDGISHISDSTDVVPNRVFGTKPTEICEAKPSDIDATIETYPVDIETILNSGIDDKHTCVKQPDDENGLDLSNVIDYGNDDIIDIKDINDPEPMGQEDGNKRSTEKIKKESADLTNAVLHDFNVDHNIEDDEKSDLCERQPVDHDDLDPVEVKGVHVGSPTSSDITGHADSRLKGHSMTGGGLNSTNAFRPAIPSGSLQVESLRTAVIIDNGSGLCKCGMADRDLPSCVFPALVGRAKYEEAMAGRHKDHYLGDAAQAMRGVLKLNYPLEHGIITDWDDMELLWEHVFYDQLRIDPAEHPVMLTEAPLNPKRNRERMAEIMFEEHNTPATYIAVQAVLALFASGRTTGVVFDSGDGVSHIVPVYEGYCMPHAIQRLDLAGRDVTHYLVKLLREAGHSFTTSAEMEIVRDMKETYGYVAADYEAELKQTKVTQGNTESYILPDGQNVALTSERFRCAEVLFKPSLIGRELPGVHEALYSSIYKCDIDIRQDLLHNIVLSGGSTTFPGLPKRLHNEVSSLVHGTAGDSVKVRCPEDQKYLVWKGGAVLASLYSFQQSWVFRQEYDEYGLDIIHRKCF